MKDKRQVGLETEKVASRSLVDKCVGRGRSSGSRVFSGMKSWV